MQKNSPGYIESTICIVNSAFINSSSYICGCIIIFIILLQIMSREIFMILHSMLCCIIVVSYYINVLYSLFFSVGMIFTMKITADTQYSFESRVFPVHTVITVSWSYQLILILWYFGSECYKECIDFRIMCLLWLYPKNQKECNEC